MTKTSFDSLRRSPGRSLLAALSIAGVVVVSCGGQPAPVGEWEVTWRNTVAAVAEVSTPDITREQCQDLLAYLRVQKTVLGPVPLDGLETPVDRWLLEAESIFFECDLGGEDAEQSLTTLQSLQAEVETVLEIEG